MRVPLSWLGEFVSWTEPPAILAERLTMAGLPVESIEEAGRLDARIRAGRLVDVVPHPDAERLQHCRVDLGDGDPASVVSGAPGLAAGQVVPVALPGAVLPGGRTVEAVTLRGVESRGVLCAEAEIGLGDDAGAVLVLPEDVDPGTPIADVAGVVDTVLTFEVTPNRGDCLSILGIAREVAALTGERVRRPARRLRERGEPTAEVVRVRIDAPDLCPRYCARVIRGLGRGASPLWLRLRLRRAGTRAIDAVVDATNYVMLERGQPLHAFDLARVTGGQIIVRCATAGERLVTLDGVERVLEPGDLVIADDERPVALAGVMGGQASEVGASTTSVLLESAFFDPAAVRRTSRRLGLPSQAAYRFERRVDPAMVPEALDVAAALVVRLAGGHVAPGIVEEAPGLGALASRPIPFRPERAASLLGLPLTRPEMVRRLRALGAESRVTGGALSVTPPSYRGDLGLEEDLVEEVARLGGYDAVPIVLPKAPIASGEDAPGRASARRVRRLLAAEGLAEMVTLSLTDPETNRLLPGFVGRDLAPVVVRNPLSSETGELRRTPLAGLVRALGLNLDRGASFVGCFELGRGYGIDASMRTREPVVLAMLLHGAWPPRGVEQRGASVDFLDLKGIVTNLLAGLGYDGAARWVDVADVPFLHPGKAAAVEVGDRRLGVCGALHPGIVQARDITGEVWVAELDMTADPHYGPRRVRLKPLPRFPAVTRDVAVIVDERFHAGDVVEEIRALDNPQIESVRLFDCYRGAPIPAEKKSLAYTISYRSADRSLTDDEVNAAHESVRARLAARFRLEFRS